ncbi:MAG: sulfite exporter TauE/SafE family protein [Bacteroidota bacterium]
MEVNILFLVVLFIIAILYASVGHGGASGYLALMALFGISTIFIRSSALLLNLFVSSVSFYAFYRAGYFKIKILIPFIIGSIPMAFMGARIEIDPQLYKSILGFFLIIAVARMVYRPKKYGDEIIPYNFIIATIIGMVLGFFSGLIGIGGGIILSPILLLFGWANVKETAAISSIFIFLNSMAGILGLFSVGISFSPNVIVWVVVATLGGIIGAYGGSFKISILKLRYVLAFVLLLASIKLIFT